MSRADRRLHRHIEALVNDRRPPTGEAGDDLGAMQIAARLHAAHPGSAAPSAEFVDTLARALRDAHETTPDAKPRRRQFLTAAALGAAAGIGGGLGLERLRDTVFTAGHGSQEPLVPDDGEWVAVATAAALTPGQIHRFSARGVEGFVLNVAGGVRALSAVCTDQGCILAVDPANGQILCPCHAATFALDGRPNAGPYGRRLSPLPTIQVRTHGDDIEVLIPKTA